MESGEGKKLVYQQTGKTVSWYTGKLFYRYTGEKVRGLPVWRCRQPTLKEEIAQPAVVIAQPARQCK
jgi:hypothetical protein